MVAADGRRGRASSLQASDPRRGDGKHQEAQSLPAPDNTPLACETPPRWWKIAGHQGLYPFLPLLILPTRSLSRECHYHIPITTKK